MKIFVTLQSMNLYCVHVAITSLMTACAVCKILIATIPVLKLLEGQYFTSIMLKEQQYSARNDIIKSSMHMHKNIGKNGRKNCIYIRLPCLCSSVIATSMTMVLINGPSSNIETGGAQLRVVVLCNT